MRSATRVSAVLFGAFLFVVLASVSVCFAEEEGFALISGHAYLEGAIDHSGIKVLFDSLSTSAKTDSTFTDSAGGFSKYVKVGIYKVTYSKDGHLPYSICGDQFYKFDTVLVDVTLEQGIAQHISGDLRGRLTDAFVYFADGDVLVPEGDTLIIDPGVNIRFTGPYAFTSVGLLVAQGAQGDSITFTSAQCTPTAGNWKGISISGVSNVLAYCDVEYANTGIMTVSDSTQINNSTVQHSNTGIRCYASTHVRINSCAVQNCDWGIMAEWFLTSVEINDCVVQDNAVRGIESRIYTQSITIEGCTIRRNGNLGDSPFEQRGGILTQGTPLTITNSVVEDHRWWGIINDNGGTMSNCVIRNNGYVGLSCNGPITIRECLIANNPAIGVLVNSGQAAMERCTFQDNGVGAAQPGQISSSIFRGNTIGFQNGGSHHCDFFDNTTDFEGSLPQGIGDIVTTNDKGDSCDTYLNIFLDPMQIDPDNADPDSVDYRLLTNSPCIDAGDPTLAHDRDDTIADMGAYYFNQGTPPSAPVSEFDASPRSGTLPLVVTFANLSTGAMTSHFWTFGDGTTSPLREPPPHVYTQTDTYTVSLTTTGPGGNDTETKTNYIEVLPAMMPPAADFAGSPTSGYAPLEVTFTNLTTGSVDSLRWYFGDGASSNVEDPAHVYAAADTYTVRLVAYGPYGTDQETKTDYIKVRTFLQDAPRILSLVDVPDDQGGWIRARFLRSGRDFADETLHPISNYGVWRRVDNGALVAALTAASSYAIKKSVAGERPEFGGLPVVTYEGRTFVQFPPGLAGASLPPGTWEWVAGVPAFQQNTYTAVVPTLADSSGSVPNHTVFVVTAHTTTPSIWYVSEPDSGYSIDNIVPGVPTSLAVAYNTGSGNHLSWDPSPAEDFQYFRVYRSTDPDFVPSPSEQVGSTAGTNWTDPEYDGWNVYYKITALDHVGNESDPAIAETMTGIRDSVVPNRFALYQNVPNPFNPTTMIHYDVPDGGAQVTLIIYDVSGRLVRTLVDAVETPGEKMVSWDGQDSRGQRVASGVYFCRLTSKDYSETRKMMLMK